MSVAFRSKYVTKGFIMISGNFDNLWKILESLNTCLFSLDVELMHCLHAFTIKVCMWLHLNLGLAGEKRDEKAWQ